MPKQGRKQVLTKEKMINGLLFLFQRDYPVSKQSFTFSSFRFKLFILLSNRKLLSPTDDGTAPSYQKLTAPQSRFYYSYVKNDEGFQQKLKSIMAGGKNAEVFPEFKDKKAQIALIKQLEAKEN